MGEFRNVVLGFPTAILGGALVVVAGFWVLVLAGAAGGHGPGHHGHPGSAHHAHHGPEARTGHDAHAGGHRGLLSAAGLDGVPVTVVLSLLVAVGWFLSLAGSVALDAAGVHGLPRVALDLGLLAAAPVGAWSATWILVRPLRRLFPEQRPPSRADFVGLLCTVRTGRVTDDFGQAEVTAADGSTAVVQVRRTGADRFAAGSTALICSYDEQGEFFLVAPYGDPLGDPYEAAVRDVLGGVSGPPGPADPPSPHGSAPAV